MLLPKKRTRLWVALSAVVALVIGPSSPASWYSPVVPTVAARRLPARRCKAIWRHWHAETLRRHCLSPMHRPTADKTFLTDEILKKQIEKYPITDIKILSDVPGKVM